MDLNSHQSNSGLARFRSAPSSLFSNFRQSVDSVKSERRLSRFANSSDINNTALPSFQELESEHKATKSSSEVALNLMNSQQGYNSSGGLPPHYPRHNSSSSYSSSMDSSFGIVGSLGMDHETQPKSFVSPLLRQSSSPAGLFSNISFTNGTVFRILLLVPFVGCFLANCHTLLNFLSVT